VVGAHAQMLYGDVDHPLQCDIHDSAAPRSRAGQVIGTGTEMIRIVDVAMMTKIKINCNVMVTQNDRDNLCFIGIQRK